MSQESGFADLLLCDFQGFGSNLSVQTLFSCVVCFLGRPPFPASFPCALRALWMLPSSPESRLAHVEVKRMDKVGRILT
jgi:hypothetical protein